MTSQEIMLAALTAVEGTGIDYVVVGAIAVNCYTFARTTKDADFLLGFKENDFSDALVRAAEVDATVRLDQHVLLARDIPCFPCDLGGAATELRTRSRSDSASGWRPERSCSRRPAGSCGSINGPARSGGHRAFERIAAKRN